MRTLSLFALNSLCYVSIDEGTGRLIQLNIILLQHVRIRCLNYFFLTRPACELWSFSFLLHLQNDLKTEAQTIFKSLVALILQ